MRVFLETLVAVALTAVLHWATAGLVGLPDSDFVTAFLQQAPGFAFGTFWIGYALWVVLLVIGNLWHRRRAPGWRLASNFVSAIVAGVVNTVAFFVIGLVAGGWGLLVAAIAIVSGLIFVAAALVSLLLTHLVFFRK